MMNEQIIELVEEAKKYALDYVSDCKFYGHIMEYNEYELQFEEKFSELLIKKCALIVQDFVDHRLPASEYPDRLKNYFGIDE